MASRIMPTPSHFVAEASHRLKSFHSHLTKPHPRESGTDCAPIDVTKMEGELPKRYADDVVEIPGARSLLSSIIAQSFPWAIVTSGTQPLVRGWLERLSLGTPEHLVSAESVENGKPDPTCYRIGLEKLGLQDKAGEVLVLEDSPAGIKAGKAAGCKVLGLVTSHTVEQVVAAEPDWVVKDLESVRVVRQEDGKMTLELSNALRF